MAEFETVDYSKLENLNLALTNYFAHSLPNGKLYKSTLSDLATFLAPFVSSVGASAYVPVSGNTLPNPSGSNSFSIVPAGVYAQTGEASLNLTGTFNIISWNGTTWTLLYPINIELQDNKETKFIDIPKPQSSDFFPIDVTLTNSNYYVNAKVANGGAPFANMLVPLKGGQFEAVLSERSYARILYKQNALYGGQQFSDIGMGLSFVSTNSYGYAWHASATLITLAGSPLFGKIEIRGTVSPGGYSVFYSDQIMSNYTLGDVIDFTFERLYQDYIVTAKNVTKGTQIEFKVTPGVNFSNYIPFNTANPCVYIQSGDFAIYSYEYGTTLLNPDKEIIGDSITAGSGSLLEPFRYASKVDEKIFNIISGGGADYTQSVRSRLNEIKFLKPKIVTLMIGGNDILFGIATQTWKDNLDLIAYELGLVNIKVVMIYPTARVGAGQLINYIQTSTYLKDLDFIDCNTPTAVAGTTDMLKPEYDSGDALHPNNAGHSKVAEVINQFFS